MEQSQINKIVAEALGDLSLISQKARFAMNGLEELRYCCCDEPSFEHHMDGYTFCNQCGLDKPQGKGTDGLELPPTFIAVLREAVEEYGGWDNTEFLVVPKPALSNLYAVLYGAAYKDYSTIGSKREWRENAIELVDLLGEGLLEREERHARRQNETQSIS